MVVPSKPTATTTPLSKRRNKRGTVLTVVTLLSSCLLLLLFLPSSNHNFAASLIQTKKQQQQRPSRRLPLWSGLSIDQNPDTFGTVVPIGAHDYQESSTICSDDNGRGAAVGCSVYFPLADLSNNNFIKEDFGLSTQQQQQQGGSNEDDQILMKQQPVLRFKKYDPPHILLNQSDVAYRTTTTTSSSSSTDFALLTRCGYKGPGEMINQDRIMLLDIMIPKAATADSNSKDSNVKLLALFDGHGSHGHVVSHSAMLQLPPLLFHNKNSIITSRRLTNAILKLDKIIPTANGSGATAIVMVRQQQQLLVANLGDSFGVICQYDSTTRATTVLFQTKPHKPHFPQERERIERAGGRVMLPPSPGETSRVIYPVQHMEMALAMSRSLGDGEGKKLGVLTALPTVDVVDITDENAPIFAIVATDGLMDYLDVNDVAQHLGRVLYNDNDDDTQNGNKNNKIRLVDACEQLIMRASQEWKQLTMAQYRDDISILVTKL